MSHGWLQTGEWVDTLNDPVHPRDRYVVAAMKARWPELIPIRFHTQWRTPAGTVLSFWHHGVGRYVANPVNAIVLGNVIRSPGDTVVPNVLERIFEEPRGADGKPGAFQPFTWDRYYELVRDDLMWDPNMTHLEAVQQMNANNAAEREAAREEFRKELHDRGREIEPYVKKMLERISDVEWGEFRRAHAAGQLKPRATKAFVHIQRSA